MLLNYLTTTVRSFGKNKGYTLINVLGLAVGFASVLLISIYIHHELSYESFLPQANRIYRMSDREYALTSYNHLQYLTDNLHDVQGKTLVLNSGNMTIGVGNDMMVERDFLYATEDFFDVFEYEIFRGSFSEFSQISNSVVITESLAERFFKNTEAVNKDLIIYRGSEPYPYKVVAVIKDLPGNTHMKFDVLARIPQRQFDYNRDSWGNTIYHGYFKTRQNITTTDVQKQSDLIFAKRALQNDWFPKLSTPEEILGSGKYSAPLVLNVKDIHNDSNLLFEFEAGGNERYLYVFAGTALFILILATINFVNLSTAQSMKRAKEVGVRKTLGSTQRRLIGQFLLETTVLCLLSAALAVGLLEAFFTLGKGFFNTPFDFNVTKEPIFMLGLIVAALITGLLGGAYPAFYLSAFKPSKVLKGQFSDRESKMIFRNVLVVGQFTISITLAVYVFFIQGQLRYSLEKDLGFTRDNIVIIDNSSSQLGYNVSAFKTALLEENTIINAGYNQYDLFAMSTSFIRSENAAEDYEQFRFYYQWIDDTYLETLNVEFMKGRNFSKSIASDTAAIIINETAARLLGFENPLGETVMSGASPEYPFKIIGLIKDFNHQSFDKTLPPTGFLYWENTHDQLTVRLSSDLKNSLDRVQALWSEYSDMPMDYQFLDSEFDKLFKREQQLGKVIGSFTFLAFFVACLGILGLAGHTAEQKTKEIGIRKALGATVEQIVLMFSKRFTLLVLIATLLSAPLAYSITNYWLESFAYKIALSPTPFIMASLLGLFLVTLTVSYHLIKAARANPVLALKDE